MLLSINITINNDDSSIKLMPWLHLFLESAEHHEFTKNGFDKFIKPRIDQLINQLYKQQAIRFPTKSDKKNFYLRLKKNVINNLSKTQCGLFPFIAIVPVMDEELLGIAQQAFFRLKEQMKFGNHSGSDFVDETYFDNIFKACLLYTSPSPRDA